MENQNWRIHTPQNMVARSINEPHTIGLFFLCSKNYKKKKKKKEDNIFEPL